MTGEVAQGDRVAGMQGGVNLMAGERGPQGHGGGFGIPDFADQNNVGVLAEHGANTAGEFQLDVVRKRCLANQWQGVLDRVFQGHDMYLRRIQGGEYRVQGRCFAAAGGSGHE